jgi:hypothetical protein
MKLIGLIKMCLNEMYRRVHIGKRLSDNFAVQHGLKEDALPSQTNSVAHSPQVNYTD